MVGREVVSQLVAEGTATRAMTLAIAGGLLFVAVAEWEARRSTASQQATPAA